MKKSTDTIIRIFFIVAIFGAIGNYYYQKYKKPVAPALKSDIILIPKSEPVAKTIVQKIKTSKPSKPITPKNNTVTNKSVVVEQSQKNHQKTSVKTYGVVITDIPEKSKNINRIKTFVKSLSGTVKMSETSAIENIIFTRVLVGPFKKKMDMIKASGKINDLKIDSIRLKIKGNYYIQVASFSNEKKLNDFVKFLHGKRINNIVFLKVKIPKKVIRITIENLNESSYRKLTDFLKNNNQHYKTQE